MARNQIENIRRGTPELEEAGWQGPGWYFWNEERTLLFGPMPTKALAEQQQNAYNTLAEE
jgi:hypothetical protein